MVFHRLNCDIARTLTVAELLGLAVNFSFYASISCKPSEITDSLPLPVLNGIGPVCNKKG